MNNTTTSQEELPSEVPNIFESVFFEKVRKKVTDSSEDFKCTSQEITDTVEGSNSNSLRHSQTEPMSFANETVNKKPKKGSLMCFRQDSQHQISGGRPLSTVEEVEVGETLIEKSQSSNCHDDVETSEHEFSSVPETPNITGNFKFPKVRRKSQSLGEMPKSTDFHNSTGKEDGIVFHAHHQTSLPKLNTDKCLRSALISRANERFKMAKNYRPKQKVRVDPKYDEIKVFDEGSHLPAKVSTKSVETQR